MLCDVGDEASIDAAFTALRKHWDGLDFLVHAIAFADKNYLRGRYLDTPRAAFVQALDISCYLVRGRGAAGGADDAGGRQPARR